MPIKPRKPIQPMPSTKSFPFKTIIIPIIIAAVLLIALISFGGEDKRPVCVQLQDWVDTHVKPGEKIAVDEEVYKMCPIEHYITDLPGYTPSKEPIDLNIALRGSHTMYVWIGEEEDLNMTITKQDKDWYNGADDLNIIVSGPGRKVILTETIPDNGIDTNYNYGKPTISEKQMKNLYLENPGKGVYKIEFLPSKMMDLVITQIKTRQTKMSFFPKIFDAVANKIYFIGLNEFDLNISTWYIKSLQTVTLTDGQNKIAIDLNEIDKSFTQNLGPGKYFINLTFPNVILNSAQAFFSFSEKAVFYPFNIFILKKGYAPDYGANVYISGNSSLPYRTLKIFTDSKSRVLIYKVD
ncbi:MAG: hypothetical protein V1494_03265 [Candidatus Diapherotrites archaeon]